MSRLEKRCGALEEGHLGRVFRAGPAALVGKSNDVFILPIGKLKDVYIAELGYPGLYLANIGLELILAVAKSKIVGKLTHFKSEIEKRQPKLAGRVALRPGFYWKVERYKHPHELIPAETGFS